MKKFLSLVMSLIMITALLVTFTGCSDKGESKVMTVSLNPSVEFLLDASNKVVTVNATNDEGNYIVAKAEFVGMNADEAVQAFLKISAENGFLLEGEAKVGQNNVTISISGEEGKKLYDEVAKKAEEFIKSLPSLDINVDFNFKTITKEELEAFVSDCMRELNPETLKAFTQEELIRLLENSRKATEDLLSQELKDYYYGERALEIKKAQLEAYIEAVKSEDNLGIVSATLTATKAQLDNLIEMMNSYKEAYKEKFLAKSGEYYQKMQECIAAKKELLAARLEGLSEEAIAALEKAYQVTEKALNDYKAFIDQQLEVMDNAINKLIDTIQSTVIRITETLNLTFKDIDAIVTESVKAAEENFNKAFKDENGEYIANNYWAQLNPENK